MVHGDPSPFCSGDPFCSREEDEERKSKLDHLREMFKNVEKNGDVIGLALKKTPSFVDLMEKLFKAPTALACEDEEDVMDSEKDDTQLDSEIMDLETKALSKKTKKTKAEKQQNKAINFPATSLTIGTWELIAKNPGELTGKCYFGQRRLVWEILEVNCKLKKKMEMQWSDITAMRASFPEDTTPTFEIVLCRTPQFHEEIEPQPKKHTQWRLASDFTGGQALKHRKHSLRIPDFQKHYDKLLQQGQSLRDLSLKSFPSSENLYFGSFTYERLWYGGFEPVFAVEHEYGCGAETMCYLPQYAVGHQVVNPVLPACLQVQNIESTSVKNNIVLMEASEVDAATRFQLETTSCVDPSVNLGRDMRTNYLQFVHNAGLGREIRSNDSQNMFNAASMIHETPPTNNLQFMHNTGLGREMRSNDSQNMFNASMIHETPTITGPTLPGSIKVPPTLHIPPPTLEVPNFEVPTSGTHGYSYPYLGYGERVESNHASSYHITHPGSGAHATYGGSRTHSSFLDRAGYDHMNYESGALTTYTSGAHQAGCNGEPSNYENGFVQSYHRTQEGNMGYSMIGSRGKFYGDNAAHTIYTNGAHQTDYSGAQGNNEWSPINNGNHFTLKDLRVEEGNKGLLYS
ncbi:uncharacterized protein LOC18445070 [Amborella trichopoda]|uniref:uncharacterized protein LOC18445070 n=1 Tax=Amborella trichopoda TaxID=13333 RepID=UPI0005D3197C|nr:uncharacterized protein LOC18445070 [Amborella trichopoda]|eukprot:XP_020529729.1 uncharacterized protein LOC18445070 [Amborella trichopoda]